MGRGGLPSCQACKDRRIRCTKELPVCQNCAKTGRSCKRQAFPLSWPKQGDTRRMVLARGPKRRAENAELLPARHFINVSSQEIALTTPYNLESFWDDDDDVDDAVINGVGRYLSPLPELAQCVDDPSLFSYFYNVTAAVLPRLNMSKQGIGEIVMRIAMSDNAVSTEAVLYSLLSLSSIHRDGNNLWAARFKSRALKALWEASQERDGMELMEAKKHILASLLLCRVEIALAAQATSLWGMYISSAKTILSYISEQDLSTFTNSEEGAVLYQCLHYHDVLSKFSLRHWANSRNTALSKEETLADSRERFFVLRRAFQVMPDSECLLHEVKLLDDVLTFLMDRKTTNHSFDQSAKSFNALEKRVRDSYFQSRATLKGINLPAWPDQDTHYSQHHHHSSPNEHAPTHDEDLIRRSRAHLFRAATWIYFERTVRSLAGPSQTLTNILDDSYAILKYNFRNSHIKSAQRIQPLSLLLIGAEARNDAERALVLDVMARSSTESERWLRKDGKLVPSPAIGLRSAGLGYARGLMKKMWTMEDLRDPVDGYIDYGTKLRDVISSCEILPSLL